MIASPAGGGRPRRSRSCRVTLDCDCAAPADRYCASSGNYGKIHSAQNLIHQLRTLLKAARCSHSEQLAHEPTKIVGQGRDQVALPNLFDPPQPRSPGPTRLAHMRKCAFDSFTSLSLQASAAHAAPA